MNRIMCLIFLTIFGLTFQDNPVFSITPSIEQMREDRTVNGIYIHSNVPFLLDIIKSATQTEVINKAFEVGGELSPQEKSKLVDISRQYLDTLLFETHLTKKDKRIGCIYGIFQILADSGSEENEDFVFQFLKPGDQWQLNDKKIIYQQKLPIEDSQFIDTIIRWYAFNGFASSHIDPKSIFRMNLLKIKVYDLKDSDPFKVNALEYIDVLEKIRSGELPRGVP